MNSFTGIYQGYFSTAPNDSFCRQKPLQKIPISKNKFLNSKINFRMTSRNVGLTHFWDLFIASPKDLTL